jgi:hypothetical protein
MALGIDLMSLAIDAEPGYLRVGPELPYALIVAELVDLAVAGRITLRGDLIIVLDRSPIGDVLADDGLTRLADFAHGVTVDDWLKRQGRWRAEAYLDGIRHDGVPSDQLVRHLRALIADESDPPAVQDLALMVLAHATGWPQARLRLPRHLRQRARLKRLASSVVGATDDEGDAALAVLRHGVRAMRSHAGDIIVSGEYSTAPVDTSPGAVGQYDLANRRVLGFVVDVVAVLALATLVLACLRNVDLALIISPFCLALVGVSLTRHAERRARRREAARARGDQRQGMSED